MKNIKNITDAEFKFTVMEGLVLVDFWATWCGPCKTIVPVLEAVAEGYKGQLTVVKMDVDENQVTPQAYRVSSIPMLLLFKNGNVVAQIVGVVSKAKLSAEIEKHL